MSLLAPLFLLGLAALALPLWLHRQRTHNAERRPFSSAMLLEREAPRLQVRRQWRYRVLLALRCLLLAALCCAFARPMWQGRVAGGSARAALQLIVLDTSLSMGATGRFERARAEARRLIDRLDAGQRAQIITAADEAEAVAAEGGGPSADRSALRAALERVRPGAARLDFGSAVSALDALAGQQHGLIEAHLISDFQSSGTPTRFGELLPSASPGRTIELQLHPVGPDAPEANWAVTEIRRADGAAGGNDGNSSGSANSGTAGSAANAASRGNEIDVTVRGYDTPSRSLEVALELNGMPAGSVSATVPAGGEAQFRFPQQTLRLGDNRVVARLANADALAADNVRYAVIRNTPAELVPLLTDAPNGRAAKYLATALAASDEGYRAQPQALASFDARALPRYRWVMIDDLGAIDATLAARLQTFVANGGGVFAALGARSVALRQLPLLDDPVKGSADAGDLPLGVGQLDASDPVLAGLRGWESLTIGHLLLLTLAANDRVLAAAGNGAPLLVERRIGRGRLLLFTSDLDNDWNDLPVQPLFVGLLAQTGRYLGNRGDFPLAQTVGASLTLGQDGGPAGQLIDPAGRTVLSLADTRRRLTVKLDQIGFYQVNSPAAEALVAVNPDPLESDLTPMPAPVLARWRGALAAARVAPAQQRVSSAAAPRVPLAPTLLALLTLAVLAESLLGNHSLQRRPGQGTT